MRVTHLFAGSSGRRRRSAAAQGVRLPDPAPNRAAPLTDQARLRQRALGDALRKALERVVNDPIPRDFLEILRRADRSGVDLSAPRAAPSQGASSVSFDRQAAATDPDDLTVARTQGRRVAGMAPALRAWS
jgi:hypothetical protein